jgi:hypothetical protein
VVVVAVAVEAGALEGAGGGLEALVEGGDAEQERSVAASVAAIPSSSAGRSRPARDGCSPASPGGREGDRARIRPLSAITLDVRGEPPAPGVAYTG